MKILAIDIGGMSIKYAIFEKDKIVKSFEPISLRNTNSKNGLSNKEDALNIIESIINENKSGIEGIGISSPGAITNNGYINGINGIKDFNNFDLRLELIGRTDIFVPITIINDANAAAYADYSTIKKNSTVVTIAVGTGIGGGVIVEGKMISGKRGYAGEIGIFPVFSHEHKDILMPTTGSEASGLYSLEKYFKKISGTKKTGKEIFELFDNKDQFAINAVKRLYVGLAYIVLNTFFTIDTDVIFIAGGLSKRKQSAQELSVYINNILENFGLKKDLIKIQNSNFPANGQLIGAYKYCEFTIK